MFTIVTGSVTLGITGAFAVAFQAVLALFFTLSAVERVLLGFCGFLIALAATLVVLKALRGRHSQNKAEGQKPGYWENRQMLYTALGSFYTDSAYLYDEELYEDDEVENWQSCVSELIAEALGQTEVNRFLTDDIHLSLPAEARPRHLWLEHRRQRLTNLMRVINSLSDPLEIRPDFDGREWVGSKTFRYKR
jgi:hypothetical protein